MTASPAGPTVAPIGSVAAETSVGGAGAVAVVAVGSVAVGAAGAGAGAAAVAVARRGELELAELDPGVVGNPVDLDEQRARVVAGGDRLAEQDQLLVVPGEVAACLLAGSGGLLLLGEFGLRRFDLVGQLVGLVSLRRHGQEPEATERDDCGKDGDE